MTLLAQEFHIRMGVRQGDVISPLLFNLVLEKTIREMKSENKGVNLNGRTDLLGYADHIAVLAE